MTPKSAEGGGDGAGGAGEGFIGSNWVGVLGGGLYALSPLVWMYSVQVSRWC